MISKPTQDLADAAGTMDTALAYIADELHTALVSLDFLTTEVLDAGVAQEIHRRIERLSAYVADVQARTAPAPRPWVRSAALEALICADELYRADRSGDPVDNQGRPYDPPGWKRARLAAEPGE